MFLVTAEEMREIDRRTIEDVGIPGIVLMENAGARVAKEISSMTSNDKSLKIIVLSSHGNNGGDGFVAARHLANQGYDVETWLIGDVSKFSSDTLTNYHALIHSGYGVKEFNQTTREQLLSKLSTSDIIVDALLGTGVKGKLREPLKTLITYANQSDAKKVAVDIPTGVDSNDGAVVDEALKADLTITFALPKLGHFIYPGAEYVGKLVVADISIPSQVIRTSHIKKQLITHSMVSDLLPIRDKNSHKGTFGHALIIGGSKNMPGAPTLATLAALRIGSGLTSVAVPKSIQSMVFNKLPEAICIGLPETTSGNFSLRAVDSLKLNEEKYTAVGVGPGIGIFDQGKDWLMGIMKNSNQPLVVDADGLNILADNLDLLVERKLPTILTPHPGEMAKLIKRDAKYVQQNRISVAKDFALKYQVYVVLKGANTLITTPDGELVVNTTGGPELAKGGTGDILTGMITGLIAQRLPIKDALILGVYLHGLAGTLANNPSNYSTIATEIIEKIGLAIHQTMSINANE